MLPWRSIAISPPSAQSPVYLHSPELAFLESSRLEPTRWMLERFEWLRRVFCAADDRRLLDLDVTDSGGGNFAPSTLPRSGSASPRGGS